MPETVRRALRLGKRDKLRDMATHPERLQAVDAAVVQRIQSLVDGIDVDLNAPLTAEPSASAILE